MESKDSDILEQLQDITECCICSETLRDSRVLPCIHTFCLDCLTKIQSSSTNPGDTLPCPICRSEFVIPSEGLHKLPRNFFIERVIEMTKVTKPGTTVRGEGTLCDACSEDSHESRRDDVPPATMQCVECRQSLCDECCKHHKKNKLTKTHRTVALGEQIELTPESEHGIKSGVCEAHPGKPLEIYCSTCQTVACLKCYFESHQSHACSEIGIVAENLKKQVLADIHKVCSWASEARKRLKQLGDRRNDFLSNADALDKAIVCRKEELKKLVEMQALALISQLETLKQKTIKQMENDKDSLERHLAVMESYTLYCNAVNNSGTATDICFSAIELHARAEKLLQLHESFELSYPKVETVTLIMTGPDELLKSCKNIVGKLKVSYKSKQENECSIEIPADHETNDHSKAGSISIVKNSGNCTLSLRLIHRELSRDQWAMSGIAHLDSCIYILSPSSNCILVHQDQEPLQKIREIRTKLIKSPVDIASCQKSNCLYVTDQKSSCLWKITPSQIICDQITKCLLNMGKPHTLSVTSDGCVLMTVSGSPSFLYTYHPDTGAVESIELPEEVEGPQHAVRTSTGNVIVSYGNRDRKEWNLVELTVGGKIVRRHDSRITFHRLNGPFHLAIDSNDRLIVVDFYNNRVMLFDSKLNWARMMLSGNRHGIQSPDRICFVAHKNQLIVKNRKTVDVYSFQCSQL